MLIGIEAERANNPEKTGVEHYAKQLILHLAKIDSVNEYVLFLRTKPEEWFFKLPKNFKVKIIPFPIFWTQIRLSLEMLFNPVDVLFIPASALPFIHPKCSIVTIHDVAWRYFPKSFTWFMRNFLEWSTKFAIKNASNIIAVSESTKRDLVKFYGVGEKKITVIHHGFESPNDQKLQATSYKLPAKYILFLSTIQPRKNLQGLIEAFKDLKTENPEISHKLVVVGRPGWKYQKILKYIDSYKDIVLYLGHVSDKERFSILSKADLLVLPSFYEGFGMQILEAFEAGTPVATSNVSSMPEVAKEAAIYFNPHNAAEIKNSIKAVLLDKSLADRLRQKGCERLKEFSWEKCASQTLDLIKNF